MPPSGAADGGANGPADDGGPQPTPLNDDGSCNEDTDCSHGETCDHGLCRIQLCAAPSYSSAPPLGPHRIFEPFRDLLAIDDSASALLAFDPASGAATGDSWTPGSRVLDAAGGDFYGERDEAIALAVDGSQNVTMVRQGALGNAIALGFQPIGVAAGDVDADGIDELIALGGNGEIAVCHPSKPSCDGFSLLGETGIDVTAADVDGDGYAEPVFLVNDANSASTVIVWNVDSMLTGQPQTIAASTGATLMKIAAGDLAGHGVAAVLGLEDGGWADLASDKLHVYDASGATITESSSMSVDVDATDLLAGVYDGGTRAGVLVLSDSNSVEVYSPDLTAGPTLPLGTSNATRLAMADFAGVSPAVTLQGAAQLVPGRLVPTAVLLYPPYSTQHSDGTSSILAGDSQWQSHSASDTVGLTASVGAGFEVDVPAVVKASVIDKVTTMVQTTHTTTAKVTIGDDYRVDARSDLSGPDNAAVILANGCYHAYTYVISDPDDRIGADGKSMALFVPVGGQTSLWSLKRYQKLAAVQSELPAIGVPYAVGDPSAYPALPQTLDGQPIPTSDLVLAGNHTYLTSDVARVGWQLTLSDEQATTQNTTVTVSAIGQVRLGTLVVQGEAGGTLGTAYSVSLGEQAYFGGWVPPIKDDVALYGYSFAPIVYRQQTADKTSGYFVVTYVIGH